MNDDHLLILSLAKYRLGATDISHSLESDMPIFLMYVDNVYYRAADRPSVESDLGLRL